MPSEPLKKEKPEDSDDDPCFFLDFCCSEGFDAVDPDAGAFDGEDERANSGNMSSCVWPIFQSLTPPVVTACEYEGFCKATALFVGYQADCRV